MSREEARQILKRNVNEGEPFNQTVEEDGIRWPARSHMGNWKRREVTWHARDYDIVTETTGYGKILDWPAGFLRFEEIRRLERTEHWTREHWTEDKYEWIMMLVYAGSNCRLALSVNGEHQALDLEFTDVLAAFYKLCPSVRREPGDSDVGDAAAKQLCDQAQLAKIAVKDNDALVRAAAVRRLTDQTLLAKIAVRDKYTLVRAAAVRKLSAPALLTKIAVEDKYALVRAAAAETLGDPTLLTKIAVEAAAAKQHAEQARLAKLALESRDPAARDYAVRKLTDPTLLARIAVKDWDPIVREQAVGKLTDQTLLASIAVKDKVSVVRAAAARQLAAQKETGQSQGQIKNEPQENWRKDQ